MQLVEIDKDEFQEFLKNHPLKNYLQDTFMASINALSNWGSFYVGVKENDTLLAACRIIYKDTKAGYKYFYSTRGPLLDYQDEKIVSFFTKEIKKFLKKKHGYVFRIDPTIIYKQRDIDGNVVEGGIDNTNVYLLLKKLGYRHEGFRTYFDYQRQVRFVFCLDLEGKTEEELLQNMKANTRNILRKTQKMKIRIRELTYDELPLFKKITEETSEYKDFADRSLEYYQEMYKKVELGYAKFLLAELDVQNYLHYLEEDVKKEEEKYQKLSLKSVGKRKEIEVTIKSLKKKIEEAHTILENSGPVIPLSCALFILYGDEITYSCSGSVRKYMSFNAQYAIQWYIIQYAASHGYKRYNFLGITGNFDKKDPNYGIYEFKKGFDGYVEEYLGDFNLPLNWYYFVHEFIKKIRK